MQPGNAQVETAVVRGVGGNEAGQPGRVWFVWAGHLVCPPRKRGIAIGLHAFENTPFPATFKLWPAHPVSAFRAGRPFSGFQTGSRKAGNVFSNGVHSFS